MIVARAEFAVKKYIDALLMRILQFRKLCVFWARRLRERRVSTIFAAPTRQRHAQNSSSSAVYNYPGGAAEQHQ
jgi:hypothetical protein